MADRTDELRDLFRSVTGTDEVTETQSGGSEPDERDTDARLAAIVSKMRDRYAFTADLPVEAYVQLIRLYYDGAGDEEIAAQIETSASTVVRARLDVHLLRDGETHPETSAEIPGQSRLAAEAERRSRRASQRFRTAFEELLTDADLSRRLTEQVTEDGLDGATDDAEVGVEF